ncbi:hypothetical protein BGW80DRAFT_1470173 [Lactifluus volemus]|nr:hypothetical protein BGW80DRAFT_1470173 [Lactifluus volemus]
MNDPDSLSPYWSALDFLRLPDGSIDKVLRRQRAISCACAIGEISNASADLATFKFTCGKLKQLSRENDLAIASEALSAIATLASGSIISAPDFISSVVSIVPLMEELSYGDLEATRKALKKLCDASDREEFSPEARLKFAENLAEVKPEECSLNMYTLELVNALDVEFKDLLPKDSIAFISILRPYRRD